MATPRRRRAGPGAAALLLTPGAGADRNHPSLTAIEAAVSRLRRRYVVERMDFPYRKARRKAPDRPAVLLAAIREAAEELCQRAAIAPEQLALGGRSMGGSMCSMAVAEGLPAAGLVLISYPLHPPGKPESLRTAHLPALQVPCLFVHGTRDPFASPEELTAATKLIPGPVTHEWVDGGRHDLKGADARVAERVATWLDGLRRGPQG
jgi:uncharacterized protein